MKRDYFTSADLRRISRNTNYNYHNENYLFIAKKINSPLEDKFKELLERHKRVGYLDSYGAKVRMNLSEKLMGELKRKLSHSEYEEVYGRL